MIRFLIWNALLGRLAILNICIIFKSQGFRHLPECMFDTWVRPPNMSKENRLNGSANYPECKFDTCIRFSKRQALLTWK